MVRNVEAGNPPPIHTKPVEAPLPKPVKHPHLQKALDFLLHNSFFKKIGECFQSLRKKPAVITPINPASPTEHAKTSAKIATFAERKIISKSGAIYDGEVNERNRPNGKGVFVSKEGNIYKGSFLNGKFQGQGCMEKANGDRYVGMFENNQFVSGYAIITDENGVGSKYSVEDGEWTKS